MSFLFASFSSYPPELPFRKYIRLFEDSLPEEKAAERYNKLPKCNQEVRYFPDAVMESVMYTS
jgi:hypothetical protein